MQQALESIHNQVSQSILYHYMDGILFADSDKDALENMFKVKQENSGMLKVTDISINKNTKGTFT